ncbi:conserved hypothetical protein [Cupriavidus taiwanensis]|nr:conserved hypothetical protein [Cupriavidus taiwanensis]SOZ46970.1 conserved hypothetical protein [Cupriavidus taiwanensis]
MGVLLRDQARRPSRARLRRGWRCRQRRAAAVPGRTARAPVRLRAGRRRCRARGRRARSLAARGKPQGADHRAASAPRAAVIGDLNLQARAAVVQRHPARAPGAAVRLCGPHRWAALMGRTDGPHGVSRMISPLLPPSRPCFPGRQKKKPADRGTMRALKTLPR